MITLTVELTPEQAAGLARLAEKTGFDQAMAVLYPHVSTDIRNEQTRTILMALHHVSNALANADVRGWPWVETGRVA